MRNRMLVAVAGSMLLLCSNGRFAVAGVGAKVIGEAAEYVMKTFGREAAEQGAETVSRQITKIAGKYGDEGVAAARKLGPRGMRLIEEAGENGLGAVKLINRYGNDAVWVISKPRGMAIFVKYGDDGAKALIKHKGIAEEVIEANGPSAVRALNAVGIREARQIAMLQKDGIIKAGEQGEKLLDVITRYGDKAMAFVWRNKGALTVTAVLGTFVADPEPYINGTVKLVGGPLEAAAENTQWTVVGVVGVVVLGGLAAWKTWLRRPRSSVA